MFLNLSPLYRVKSRKLISVFDLSCVNFKVGCTVFIRLMKLTNSCSSPDPKQIISLRYVLLFFKIKKNVLTGAC